MIDFLKKEFQWYYFVGLKYIVNKNLGGIGNGFAERIY